MAAAATLLGDTPTVTRSSYLHPAWVSAGQSSRVADAVAVSSERVGSRAVASLFTDPELQAAVLSGLTDADVDVNT